MLASLMRRHVDVGRDRVVVEHDRQRHRVRDRRVVAEDLVLGRRVVVRRRDHEAVGAERLGRATVADGGGRVRVHRPHQHGDAAADVLDGGPDDQLALVL
jgi:hypothetical protein